jgi:hypothetical protein
VAAIAFGAASQVLGLLGLFINSQLLEPTT